MKQVLILTALASIVITQAVMLANACKPVIDTGYTVNLEVMGVNG